MTTLVNKKRGKNTKLFRQIKGLSQDDIALKLDMSQQSYSKLESGDMEFSDEKRKIVAEILGIDPDIIDSFDENSIFNNCQINNNNNAVAYNGTYHNYNLDPDLKQLYEEKIALLEGRIKDQEKIVNDLEDKIRQYKLQK